MKIAVLSDTHIPTSTASLPDKLKTKLEGVDMIIHAGDLEELSVLDELSKIAKTEAVVGNMDSHRVIRHLPKKKILDIGKFRIGVIHGEGRPDTLIDYVKEKFKGEKLDCIIYGHSHEPKIEKIDNIMYINPGSPTDRIFAPYNSFAILEIDERISAEIVRL